LHDHQIPKGGHRPHKRHANPKSTRIKFNQKPQLGFGKNKRDPIYYRKDEIPTKIREELQIPANKTKEEQQSKTRHHMKSTSTLATGIGSLKKSKAPKSGHVHWGARALDWALKRIKTKGKKLGNS
jgi:hypothetical protein